MTCGRPALLHLRLQREWRVSCQAPWAMGHMGMGQTQTHIWPRKARRLNKLITIHRQQMKPSTSTLTRARRLCCCATEHRQAASLPQRGLAWVFAQCGVCVCSARRVLMDLVQGSKCMCCDQYTVYCSILHQYTMGPGPGLVTHVLWRYCMRLASSGVGGVRRVRLALLYVGSCVGVLWMMFWMRLASSVRFRCGGGALGAVRRLAAPAARPQHPMTLAACNTATSHAPPALALAP